MATVTFTGSAPLTIEPLSPVVGAGVRGIDLREPPSEEAARAVNEALFRYCVLCFPDQKITPEDQVRFAGLFGKVDSAFRRPPSENLENGRQRGMMLVTNIRKDGKPIGFLPDGEMQFHSDGAHRELPYRATTLYAIKIPSRGGETLFANLQAAYDALPETTKRRIADLKTRVVYRYDAVSREGTDEDDPNMASATHALVKVHPGSGRKSLYLSRLMTRNVVGMARAESDALLDELFAHAEKPEFVYAHRWTPGDLVIWDNRSVNHARTDFPADEVRLLRRYTVSEP
jgi:taurine dioxygenase